MNKLPPFLQDAYNEWFSMFGHAPIDRTVVAHRRPLLYAAVSSRDMQFCLKLNLSIESLTIYTYQLKTPDELENQPTWEYV